MSPAPDGCRAGTGILRNGKQPREDTLGCIACRGIETEVDSSASRSLSLPLPLKVVRCRRCSLRWLSPVRSREDYRVLYESSYFEELPEEYGNVVAGRVPHFRARVERMKGWFGDRSFKLLDIGAASGEFLRVAREAGINGHGIEPSESACRTAEEKFGIRLMQGDFFDIPLERNLYDVVHMNHVLEHISCPRDCLMKIHRILKDGGYLMIEVPYQFGNAIERVFSGLRATEPRPFSLYSIHHPFFYTPDSLKRLLEDCAFHVKETNVWGLYLSSKLAEARRYCRFPALSALEKYAHLLDTIWKEKGRFVSFEICAQKT